MCEACSLMVNHNQRTQDENIERVLDARVQRRLATDSAYRNAENAEEQAEREDEIAGSSQTSRTSS